MKRKLIKQGGGGLTLYVPKKWVDFNNLNSGDELNIQEEDNKLILQTSDFSKQKKSTVLHVETGNSNEISLIRSFYRAGYDEIIIKYQAPELLQKLQKAVDSLYGFEIFDISANSCKMKSLYHGDSSDIHSHFNRLIHSINLIKSTIKEDLRNKKFDSKQILEYKNNVFKQRDLISRIIHDQKLFGLDYFPYYLLAYNLSTIARNYYFIYENISKKKVISKESLNYLEETNIFFDLFFKNIKTLNSLKLYKRYIQHIELGNKLINNKKQSSLIVSYCLFITQTINSCDVHILNHFNS
ncbi:AbrB/MazE/SpoVT family DNA-binding domain-containing protein [archaeon]|jgi:hypothetical protein|nr:AbrB/MazE/SpoVT family DNA-binding domain-containing protein [archaeon]MBT4417010.1 AbrB/MazE/SpoVT family DNA-binding domain-containing protein [archaeon]